MARSREPGPDRCRASRLRHPNRPAALRILTATSISLKPNMATRARRSWPTASRCRAAAGNIWSAVPIRSPATPITLPRTHRIRLSGWPPGTAPRSTAAAPPTARSTTWPRFTAAHPTMPLPSYARVTNLSNGYSIIVRVNDRGPYHGGRVMDVSSRVADVLDFKGVGTARVKVEYVGPAPMEGSDDSQLLASLRTDGSQANMIGYSAPVMMAAAQTETIFSFFSAAVARRRRRQPEPAPVEVASRPRTGARAAARTRARGGCRTSARGRDASTLLSAPRSAIRQPHVASSAAAVAPVRSRRQSQRSRRRGRRDFATPTCRHAAASARSPCQRGKSALLRPTLLRPLKPTPPDAFDRAEDQSPH